MWISIVVYLVISLLAFCWLASNTDGPPISWKQWLVALLMGGPWMLTAGAILWCLDHLPQFSARFNNWWKSLE